MVISHHSSFFNYSTFMEKCVKIVIDQDCVDRYNALYFKEHPKARKLRITTPQHPSMNTYYKTSFQAANNIKQTWKDFIIWYVREIGLDNIGINKCQITYTTYFKTNRRHDADNISPKFIFDGFVEAGLLIDDDLEHITSLTINGGIDKENPRMEFLIEIL